MVANWPEITEFCRCCSLKTGIYITASFQLTLYGGLFVYDLWQIAYWSHLVRDEESHCNISQCMIELEQRTAIFRQVIIQYISRIILKVVLVTTIVFLMYGMYSNKLSLISMFLKFNIPVWVINTSELALNVFFYDYTLKFIMVFSALINAYQLVAVRSMHRLLAGKSMIYKESDMGPDQCNTSNMMNNTYHSNDAAFINTTDQFNHSTMINNTHEHCSSTRINSTFSHSERCNSITNNEERVSSGTSLASTSADRPNPCMHEEVAIDEGSKELNLKDQPTVFDPNQLVPRRHPLIEDSTVDGGESFMGTWRRPSSLPISLGEEKKKAIDDTPVIYDQDQLKTGRSPIVED